MALAVFAVPAMAQCGSKDILGQGVFETGNTAFKIPADASVNFDSVEVGNDNALAVGGSAQVGIGFGSNMAAVTAQNNLKIKKSQDSGDAECCAALGESYPCKDCSIKTNVEQIKVGSRSATAIGLSAQGTFPFARSYSSTLAQNNVEIVTNQC